MFMCSVITRTLELICVVAALICVCIGKGLCDPSGEDAGCNKEGMPVGPSYPYSVGTWRDARNSYIYGQYWVLASTLLLGVMTVVSLIFAIAGNKLALQTASFGSLICPLNGGLEVWYTIDGYYYMTGRSGYDYFIQSWAAAAAFFFILMVIYIIDSAIEYRGHDH